MNPVKKFLKDSIDIKDFYVLKSLHLSRRPDINFLTG